MTRIIFILIFYFCLSAVFATRFLGGDISYRSIDSTGLTYELTYNVYACSDTGNVIVNIYAGPSFFGPVQFVPDTTTSGFFNCHNCIAKKYSYVTIAAYPGPGNYLLDLVAYNRVDSIVNIPNSGNSSLIARVSLLINPFNIINNSPVFQTLAIDEAAVNTLFIHNPIAVDSDGDSLSYHLGACIGVAGYYFPLASNSFSIDSITGDLTWDSPLAEGFYSVGIIVREHRNGNLIGYVQRDMLINVCQVSGIDDLIQENGFSVFPNPVTNQLTIDFDYLKSHGNGINIIEINDVLGEKIFSKDVTAGNTDVLTINTAEFTSGIYFVSIKTAEGTVKKKLVVQR